MESSPIPTIRRGDRAIGALLLMTSIAGFLTLLLHAIEPRELAQVPVTDQGVDWNKPLYDGIYPLKVMSTGRYIHSHGEQIYVNKEGQRIAFDRPSVESFGSVRISSPPPTAWEQLRIMLGRCGYQSGIGAALRCWGFAPGYGNAR